MPAQAQAELSLKPWSGEGTAATLCKPQEVIALRDSRGSSGKQAKARPCQGAMVLSAIPRCC